MHQRLPWGNREDQPKRLAQLLGFSFVFHRLLNFGIGGYGIGIASREKPSAVYHHLLPSVKEQRGLLELAFGEEGQDFRLFCTHWGLQPSERLLQAKACANIVQKSSLPTLFTGDLNATSLSPEVRLLLQSAGLSDIGAEEARATFPSDNPTERIDYLLCSPQWQKRGCGVLQSPASDHIALYADVSCETVIKGE